MKVKALAKSVNVKVGHRDEGLVVHSLRHFFETFCINSRIPQPVVDAWMGHAGHQGTGALYYQLSDAESQKFIKQVPFEMKSATSSKGEANAA